MDETARVLFIDDDENILKSLRRLVSDEGFDVLLACCGEEGLALLRETADQNAVIVSDQRMPGMPGAKKGPSGPFKLPHYLRIIFLRAIPPRAAACCFMITLCRSR